MKYLFFAALLFAGSFSQAETYYLRDYLLHVQSRINSSRDLSELASKTPGTLEQRTAFVKALRDKKIENQRVPKAKIAGTTLEFDLTPKLVVDYAQLDKLILKVNGKTLSLKNKKDWMEQFNQAYPSQVSLMSLFVEPAQAQGLEGAGADITYKTLYTMDGIDKGMVQPVKDLASKAMSKVSSAAGTVYAYSLGTYIRCKEGIDDCPFFSHDGTVTERLTWDMLRGLKQFQCEDGKLKRMEALEAVNSDMLVPSYEFNYQKGSDVVKINVKNYGLRVPDRADCEFSYNDKTKEINNLHPENKKCSLFERSNLNTIGYFTPIAPAFRCCASKSCEKKVTEFMKRSQANASEAQKSKPQQVPTPGSGVK